MKVCPACQEGNVPAMRACGACGADLAKTPARAGTDLAGMLLDGSYELQEHLREGGMGYVYRALHRRLGSSVAVKLLKPTLDPDPSRTRRFETEARSASQLNHPHIINVVDFGQSKGELYYLVSEYLRGETLAQILDSTGPLPLPRALRLLVQLLAAVEHAHAHRVLHRDLKPDNLMVMPLRPGEDYLKLLDFGIAKVLEPHRPRMTVEGQVFGTPEYMAPEQATGGEVTIRSDLYACAVIFWEMLVGRPPFLGPSVVETLAMHLHDPVPSVVEMSRQPLPADLDVVLRRAMAKSPGERFANVGALRDAVMGVFQGGAKMLSPCNVCGRTADSTLGYCSDHCARGLADEEWLVAAAKAAPPPAEKPRPSGPRRATLPTGFALHAAVAQGPAEPEPATPSLGPRRARTVRLVGRQRALDEVTRFLEGHRNVLEILGPAGCGKSTMLSVVGRVAAAAGLKVVRVTPDPAGAKVPWRPVQGLLRDALGLATVPPTLEELRRAAVERGLNAEDVMGLGDILELPRPHQPEDGAVLLREMGCAAVRALTLAPPDSAGLCLLVDEVDTLDGPTQQFVRTLCRDVAGTETRVVVASEATILGTLGTHAVLYLDPLALTDVEALLRESTRTVPSELPAVARRLFEHAEGSPLFAIQAIRYLGEGGTDTRGPLPDLLRRRLELLPPDALIVVRALAVLGLRAPVDLVQAVAGQDVHVPEVVPLLTERGWLDPEYGAGLAFAHPLLADVAHDALPPQERQALHARAYQVQESRGEAVMVLARHAFEAKLEERSLELQEQAGDVALKAQDAQAAAMTHYRRALHVARWELLMAEMDEPHQRISLKLAEALRLAGHHMASEVVLKAMEPVCRNQPSMLARVAVQMARLERARRQEDKALELLRQARDQVRPAGQPAVALEIELEIGEILTSRKQWADVLQETGLGMVSITASSATPPRGFWRLLLQQAAAARRMGDMQRAVQVVRQAVAQAQQEQSVVGRAQAHLALGRVADALGQPATAEEHLAACVDLFQQLGDRRNAAAGLLARAGRSPAKHARLIREAMVMADQLRWVDGVRAAERLAAQAASQEMTPGPAPTIEAG